MRSVLSQHLPIISRFGGHGPVTFPLVSETLTQNISGHRARIDQATLHDAMMVQK
jgi:hypothetical protein